MVFLYLLRKLKQHHLAVMAHFQRTERRFKEMANVLDDVKSAVARNGTVIGSAIALLDMIKVKLDELIAAGGTDPVALKAISTELGARSDELAASVVKNTPASTEPPPTVAAWQPSFVYDIGDRVTNGGNTYVCDSAGTSATSGGPTGDAADQVDGSASWDFVAAEPLPSMRRGPVAPRRP